MAQSSEMVLLVATLLLTFSAATATEFIVGGDNGWVLPIQANGFDYTTWADYTTNSYTVGDTLVFKYKKEFHSLLQVSGEAFANAPLLALFGAFKEGNTTIQLAKEGRMWFICGAPGHCAQGQRFKITVAAAGSLPVAPAASPQFGAGNALFKPSKTAVILGSIIAGASYLL